jgi:hypothetical protein
MYADAAPIAADESFESGGGGNLAGLRHLAREHVKVLSAAIGAASAAIGGSKAFCQHYLGLLIVRTP